MEQALVTAVTHELAEAKVTVTGVPDRPGSAARLFRGLADRSVNVDMIVQNTSLHGTDRHLFHRPELRPGREHPGGREHGPRAGCHAGWSPTPTWHACRSSVPA